MTAPSFEESRKLLAQKVQRFCSSYGLYGNVVYYAPSPFTRADESNRNRLYIIAGLHPDFAKEPLPAWIQPDRLLQRNLRNNKLFYTDAFVLEVTPGLQEIEITNALRHYAQHASFLLAQYRGEGLPLPQKMRLHEVNHLMSLENQYLYHIGQPRAKSDYLAFQKALFRRERKRNPLHKKWLDYYCSEHFPDGEGPIARIRGFFRRNNPEISVERLFDTNENIKKLELQEYEFRHFRKYIQDLHPEVCFAVGNRETVNHGLTPASKVNQVLVRNVTLEEYNAVRKARFAEEGYAALADMNPSKWIFRDIYYRAVDEPIIASVCSKMRLEYAKCNTLEELSDYGELAVIDVPEPDFMNFVSLAKTNGLRFYIDTNGDYALPSLDTVHVLYNTCQEEKMSGIYARLCNDKLSHMEISDAMPTLESQISHSKEHMRPACTPAADEQSLHQRE